jgi:hypothetical protein
LGLQLSLQPLLFLDYFGYSFGHVLFFTTPSLFRILASLGLLPALQHSSPMYSDQRKWAIVFVPIVTQELDPDISRPYLRIFNQECLYLSRVSSLVCSQIFPLLHLHWVFITDTNPERSNHAGEEFVVGKDESIDPDIFL